MAKLNRSQQACATALANHLQPELFRSLCDPVRVAIVTTLATRDEATSVSEIASCCGIDFSGVSRHLKILREAGVLVADREGRQVLYSFDCAALAKVLRELADKLDDCGNACG